MLQSAAQIQNNYRGILILFSPVIIILLIYVFSIVRYKRTSYYRVTKNSFFKVMRDKGLLGEYEIFRYLKKHETDGARFLFNLYLPKGNNETTEVDVLLICTSGIFVFESKNYSGWIFGDEKQNRWTQTLPVGKGKKAQKEHFLNPIRQNKLHISTLQNLLSDPEIPYYSIIVFSNRCELKNITLTDESVQVIHRREVSAVVKNVRTTGKELSRERIHTIYDSLYSYSQVSDEAKRKHIDDIQNHLETGNEVKTISPTEITESVGDERTDASAVLLCPKCGSALVLRTAKKGDHAGQQFYGCSAYPKCRYIKML